MQRKGATSENKRASEFYATRDVPLIKKSKEDKKGNLPMFIDDPHLQGE